MLDLGEVVMTDGVADTVPAARVAEVVRRHGAGDWGLLGPEDVHINAQAVRSGGRIVSVYLLDPDKPDAFDNRLIVITERIAAVRLRTTVLLPAEY